MKKTILIIRTFFFVLCIAGAFLLHYAADESDTGSRALSYYITFGALLGALTILTDIFIKGFSIRGLTAVSFGLGMGLVISFLISVSPLFEQGDEEAKYLARLSLFIICTYLGTVITLRGKDEFNLVIPYVKFVPQKVDLPIVVIDTSALIDGRIAGICKAGFLPAEIVIPRFIIDELQRIADATDPLRKDKGRKGLQVLSELRKLNIQRVVIHDSDLEKKQQTDAKLIYIAKTLGARLLTVDYNLAKLAEFQGVDWLNINALARALKTDISIGERFDIDLVKPGKEDGQALGFLTDGSMVVVNDAFDNIGQTVQIQVISVLPSAGGKIVFGKLAK